MLLGFEVIGGCYEGMLGAGLRAFLKSGGQRGCLLDQFILKRTPDCGFGIGLGAGLKSQGRWLLLGRYGCGKVWVQDLVLATCCVALGRIMESQLPHMENGNSICAIVEA